MKAEIINMKSENHSVEKRVKKQVRRKRRRKRRLKVLRFLMFFISICVILYVSREMGEELIQANLGHPNSAVQASEPIEYMLQNPELPNGCEAVSMTMLLRSYGVQVDVWELAMDYISRGPFEYYGDLRYGPDPELSYVGDPSSKKGGWYCFETPLIEGANRYLADLGSDLKVEKISGASVQTLEKYLNKGCPVVVWLTSDYDMPRYCHEFTWVLPDGSEYIPYHNLHCVLMTRIKNGSVYLADPLQGEKVISKTLFEELFEQMGKRAIVVK